MARWYVLIGPYEAKPATLETQLALREDGYEGVRVAKLRDRTGPSVAERLAALEDRLRTVETDEIVTKRLAALESALGEPVCVGCGGTVGQHHAPDGGGCSGWFPTVREHLARIETEHRAAVYRISDLERLPVASPPATTEPTPEQIEAYLRRSAEWEGPTEIAGHSGLWWHRFRDGFVIRADEDESAFFELLQEAESRTPAEMRARILGASVADPDRLVKVATDDDLLDLFERSEYASGDTRAARRALYDLGREHGRAERDIQPTPERDPLRDPREGDWFVDGNDASVRRVVLADDIKVLYEVDGELTEMSIDAWRMYRASGHARPMTPAEVAAFKADGTRPATLTAAEMAAELREAGWSEGSGWRSPRDTLFAWHRYTADAYAAMRAAKGAK